LDAGFWMFGELPCTSLLCSLSGCHRLAKELLCNAQPTIWIPAHSASLRAGSAREWQGDGRPVLRQGFAGQASLSGASHCFL